MQRMSFFQHILGLLHICIGGSNHMCGFRYSQQIGSLSFYMHHSSLLAQSFSPLYGWRTALVLSLNATVYKELRTSCMSFEVFPLAASEMSVNRDIWLATATAPCETLLSETGVKGWLNLLSRKGAVVGALEVAIKFKPSPSGKLLHMAAESSMP
ncbi:hypothetical protein O6H91_09G050700 [Diphasiastrum complanatum]|uniref:Uncharacterized protein n=1 Tax=Diphasiastrum complanatum TaxID=34168 RepID=A0ACC2CNX5_DIPCM|nr:hypothetical protein O6H91_09G050700 [Diphasiastrum complanatum]